MKNTLFIVSIFVVTSIFSPLTAQQKSVLDFDLVPKSNLADWVENYGFSKLDALAESGDPVAQRRIGRYYSFIKDDQYTAAKWYIKGAQNNDVYATNNLGAAYYEGDGVEQSYNDALIFYQKAFKLDTNNITGAMQNLYISKGDTWTNKYRAKWYLEDAPAGNKVSQFYLAEFYKDGKGDLPKDISLAKKWYTQSANQEFKPAVVALVELNREFSNTEELVSVEELVEVEEIVETILESTETSEDEYSSAKKITNVLDVSGMSFTEMIRWLNDNSELITESDPRFTDFEANASRSYYNDELYFSLTENGETKNVEINLSRITETQRLGNDKIVIKGDSYIAKVKTKNSNKDAEFLKEYSITTENSSLRNSLYNILDKIEYFNKNFSRTSVDIDKKWAKNFIERSGNTLVSFYASQSNTLDNISIISKSDGDYFKITCSVTGDKMFVHIPISKITFLQDGDKRLGVKTDGKYINFYTASSGKNVTTVDIMNIILNNRSNQYSMYIAMRIYIDEYRREHKENYGKDSVPEFDYKTNVWEY